MGLGLRWPIGVVFTVYGLLLVVFRSTRNPPPC